MSELLLKAEQNAKVIEKYLYEKYKPGELIAKAMLRNKFELPYVRSVFVWSILAEHGFPVERHYIVIPTQVPKD